MPEITTCCSPDVHVRGHSWVCAIGNRRSRGSTPEEGAGSALGPLPKQSASAHLWLGW